MICLTQKDCLYIILKIISWYIGSVFDIIKIIVILSSLSLIIQSQSFYNFYSTGGDCIYKRLGAIALELSELHIATCLLTIVNNYLCECPVRCSQHISQQMILKATMVVLFLLYYY